METSLEPLGAPAPAVPTAAGSSDPVTVYLARLTSAESRRAMATSLELLAELLLVEVVSQLGPTDRAAGHRKWLGPAQAPVQVDGDPAAHRRPLLLA